MVLYRMARAKVNLNLAIVGRLKDGYHRISSLVVFLEYGDKVGVSLNSKRRFTLRITGKFARHLKKDNNLVLRAVTLLYRQFPHLESADIHLEKNLPVASGLGGGSSDASATIKALLVLWGLKAPPFLGQMLLSLGCDLPMCYGQRSCIVQGVGMEVTPIDFPRVHLVVVNPNIFVSTREIFSRYGRKFSSEPRYPHFSTYEDVIAFLRRSANDLTPIVGALYPKVIHVLSYLSQNGADFAAMSGSGGSCYGLCADALTAHNLAQKIKMEKDWWVVATATSVISEKTLKYL